MNSYVYEFILVSAMEDLLVPEVQRCYDRGHTSVCVVPGTTEQGDKVWVVVTGVTYDGYYEYLGDWFNSIEESMEEPKRICNCVGDQVDPMTVILSW